jgi:isopenicillin N synthase-like dioxygenase
LEINVPDDVGGLQARNAAGKWIDAPPIIVSLFVNVGTVTARRTKGVPVSSTHRAIGVGGVGQYSPTSSLDPGFDADPSALPTCTSPTNPPRRPPTMVGLCLLENGLETIDDYRDRRSSAKKCSNCSYVHERMQSRCRSWEPVPWSDLLGWRRHQVPMRGEPL